MSAIGDRTAALAPLDPALNAVWDAFNRWAPWLWFPFEQPAADADLPPFAHALYVVHGAPAVWLARRRSSAATAVVTAGLAAGWVLFTGSWDRRAQAGRSARWT